jgi:hypothetical protein
MWPPSPRKPGRICLMASLCLRQPRSGLAVQTRHQPSLSRHKTGSCHEALQTGTANYPASHVAIPDMATKPSSSQAGPASCAACTCDSPDESWEVKGVTSLPCQCNRPDLATRPSRLGLPTIQLLMSPFLMWPPCSRASTPPHRPHGQLLVSSALILLDLLEASSSQLVTALARILLPRPQVWDRQLSSLSFRHI